MTGWPANASQESLHLPGHAGGIQLDASQYYGLDTSENPRDRHKHRNRTYSSGVAGGAAVRKPALLDDERVSMRRRFSHGQHPFIQMLRTSG